MQTWPIRIRQNPTERRTPRLLGAPTAVAGAPRLGLRCTGLRAAVHGMCGISSVAAGQETVPTRHHAMHQASRRDRLDLELAARGSGGVGWAAKAEGIWRGRGGQAGVEGGVQRLRWRLIFAYSHFGTETVKSRMGAVGMWGNYCRASARPTASTSSGRGRRRAR